ncbi:transposase [Niveibacterium sp. SC-1]|uniref:transposase n=1 Tax=Niveibacterium sp. SC-1 TaxID=3135646 RepID=UPI0031201D73
MLLKVILSAYAEGVVSSRGIERLCREHVTFIALRGDTAPHFTTLAAPSWPGSVKTPPHSLPKCSGCATGKA